MRKQFRNLTQWTMALVATGALVLSASNTLAQPAGGRGGRATMLDDQQRELFRQALQKNNDQLRALDNKLQQAQKELMHAALAENFDEKVVQEKADAVAKIQAQITVLNAKALSTVAPTLKPEQKQELETSRFGAMMLSGGFTFMNRGTGGGRGRGGPPQGRPGR